MSRANKESCFSASVLSLAFLLLLGAGAVHASEAAENEPGDAAAGSETILLPVFVQPIFVQPIFTNAFCQADCGDFSSVSCSTLGSCQATDCSIGQPGFVQCGSNRTNCPAACSQCTADGHCNSQCVSDPDCSPDPCAQDGICNLLCALGGGTDPDCEGGGSPNCLANGVCNCNCILTTGQAIGDPDCSPTNNCVNCQTRPDCTDHAHCGPGFCSSTDPHVIGTCTCP